MTTADLRTEAERLLDSGEGKLARLLHLVADTIDGTIAKVREADKTESTTASSTEGMQS